MVNSIEFNKLDFVDADLEPPIISESNMIVRAHNVALVANHMNDMPKFFDNVLLVFAGVKHSTRNIMEYKGDPKEGIFLEPKTIIDGPFDKNISGTENYEFEGRLIKPLSWVSSWVVECKSLKIEIKKNQGHR